MTKWSKAQRAKFKATMARKRANRTDAKIKKALKRPDEVRARTIDIPLGVGVISLGGGGAGGSGGNGAARKAHIETPEGRAAAIAAVNFALGRDSNDLGDRAVVRHALVLLRDMLS